MKKYFYLIFPFMLLALFLFFNDRISADKGRKHYEESGQVLWEINTKEKVIALTFDDGPHEKYTTEILDLLANYNAKSTFFVVGENAEKYPDVIFRMHEEGHEIANHTFTHPIQSSVPNLLEEIKKTHDTIYGISGYAPTLFRPVEGRYTDGLIEAVVGEGYKIVMWSWHLDTLDWKDPGVEKIVDLVLKGAQPGNVVLFHDGGGNRTQTVQAIEKILPKLEKEGYRFVTISELLELKKMDNVKREQNEIRGK